MINALQSVGGTLACFIGGFLAALLLVLRFQHGNFIEQPMSLREAALGSALGALAGAIAESFDTGPWDNIPTVMASAIIAHVVLYQEVPLEPKLEL